MSLEEIIQAARQLPRQDRQRIIETLRRDEQAVSTGDGAPAEPSERPALNTYRRRLADKIDWQGGDGLEYQQRIRAEWDDRPGSGS